MDLMHDEDSAPNISRIAYGDSISSLTLLAGIMAALLIRERTGVGQEVDVSLYNTAVYALGFDISGCLITGEDPMRPQRRTMGNPIRNLYPTRDKRWIMLGMTNAQHYWPSFCIAIGHPELENNPKFATYAAREQHAAELVGIIESIFRSRTYVEWAEILKTHKIIWSPVVTPLEVTMDEQATANDFFVEWDHPNYGKIKVINNPIKFSWTPARIKMKAPDLGEHTEPILKELGYSDEAIAKMKKDGYIE